MHKNQINPQLYDRFLSLFEYIKYSPLCGVQYIYYFVENSFISRLQLKDDLIIRAKLGDYLEPIVFYSQKAVSDIIIAFNYFNMHLLHKL